MAKLSAPFFEHPPVECARALIGTSFTHGGVGGMIVETEAYLEVGDEACHTFFRPSAQRFVDQHDAGTSYVYLNYGMYWLVNVLVKGSAGNGFVLLRALDPQRGIDEMRFRRKKERLTDLCSGPGKLSMALAMDDRHHGIPIAGHFEAGNDSVDVLATPRIGISRATHHLWRFCAADNAHVSRAPRSK